MIVGDDDCFDDLSPPSWPFVYILIVIVILPDPADSVPAPTHPPLACAWPLLPDPASSKPLVKCRWVLCLTPCLNWPSSILPRRSPCLSRPSSCSSVPSSRPGIASISLSPSPSPGSSSRGWSPISTCFSSVVSLPGVSPRCLSPAASFLLQQLPAPRPALLQASCQASLGA